MNNTAPSLALYVLNHFTEPTLAQEKPYSRRGLGKRGGKREGGAEREAAREEEVIGLQRNLPQRAASGVVPVKEWGSSRGRSRWKDSNFHNDPCRISLPREALFCRRLIERISRS